MSNNREHDIQQTPPLILIVDDTPRNLQVLASTLVSTGYKISAATSAIKALKTLENIIPDLILLDVMMPEMNGFELCQKLKENESTKEIPVIFLTAKTDTDDIVTGFQSGGVDYLTKPFNSTELLARVQTHLQLKRSKELLFEKNKKIEQINNNLTDSLNYARHIQQAILPKKQDIKAIFKESFIYFKPRDIVSGDFFWISNRNNRAIVAAVDCTGHGVPGAFISILSYKLLHDIIHLSDIYEPHIILNEVHRGIESVFAGKKTNISGGMDISLCSFDLENRTLQFAGARTPLVYIQNKELYQLKGDKFSIGAKSIKEKNRSFAKQDIDIPEDATFYLFSDGFLDQLGTQHQRFTRKRFTDLLLEIHTLPMKEQEKKLDKSLKQWMGNEYGQIDDVLVIGFKV
jgi:phosphoserine phosphatase RsbU/P